MKKDLLLKRYLSDDDRYADLINGFVFGGRQLVKADDLVDLDTQVGDYDNDAVGRRSKKKKHRIRYRDLIRKAAFGVNFVVVGIENQEQVHYLMPLRIMSYDCNEYQRQAEQIRKEIIKDGVLTSAEFLSGFRKDDKLQPCVTLVLYYGKEWDGSYDLHGLLDFSNIPQELKPFVSNYKMNLVEIRKLEKTDFFRTDLKYVLDFIRFSEDEEKLRNLVLNEPAYQKLDEAAYDVAVAFAKADNMIGIKEFYNEEGTVNMCKAINEMLRKEKAAGIQQGILQGIQVLIESCRDLGVARNDVSAVIVQRYNMATEQVNEYMDLYW